MGLFMYTGKLIGLFIPAKWDLIVVREILTVHLPFTAATGAALSHSCCWLKSGYKGVIVFYMWQPLRLSWLAQHKQVTR